MILLCMVGCMNMIVEVVVWCLCWSGSMLICSWILCMLMLIWCGMKWVGCVWV